MCVRVVVVVVLCWVFSVKIKLWWAHTLGTIEYIYFVHISYIYLEGIVVAVVAVVVDVRMLLLLYNCDYIFERGCSVCVFWFTLSVYCLSDLN